MKEMKSSIAETTEYWKKYELGKNHHNQENLYETTAEAYRMYEGDQWYGIGNEAERLPVLNFVASTVKYKSSMIAKQNIQIVYSSMNVPDVETENICNAVNKYATRQWERQKMTTKMWHLIKDACIAGDSYIYFYNKNLDSQIIDNTNIYFADEQQSDLQKQRYIIIYERRPVGDVRAEAKKNKVKQADIELITADTETDTTVGNINEVTENATDGKCSCLLVLSRDENGNVQYCRSTRNVVYEPNTPVEGLTIYPIAPFVWIKQKNSARGTGEVKPMIPNQIEINRMLARRLISAKMNAFAKPVYVENMIDNPNDVSKVGEAIKVKQGNIQDIKNIFGYIAPAPMSQEAGLLMNSLLDLSRTLAGSGDAAMGNINPERTSGAAIVAIYDQAAIPLNEQVALFKQLVEDIALIWLNMWQAYYADKDIEFAEIKKINTPLAKGRLIERTVINKGDFGKVDFDIKIDATPTTPFSLYAQEQSIEMARNAQMITFEEYVEALPENSNAPKAKFQEIINKRAAMPYDPMAMQQGTAGTNTPMSQGGVGTVPKSLPTGAVMPSK